MTKNPNVVEVPLSPVTKRRLEAIARGGYFGGNAPAVARRFIEDGIRKVREKGWLADPKLPPEVARSSPTGETPDG